MGTISVSSRACLPCSRMPIDDCFLSIGMAHAISIIRGRGVQITQQFEQVKKTARDMTESRD